MPAYFDNGLFFGEGAWHGLGTTLAADAPERFSVNDAISLAGMNWTVETREIFTGGSKIDSHKAIVRTDNNAVLGVVGNRYTPLQNRDMFNWFQPFLDTQECAFETCGTLKDGTITWVLAKVNRADAVISQGDTLRKYLLLTSSHDGSKATSVGFCPIRVVCWNTLSAGLSDSRSTLLRVKHTTRQKSALAAIRDTINLVDETFEATAAQYRKLLACGIDREGIRVYVKKVLELPESELSTRQTNILDGIIDLCINGKGNDGRTVWSAYNGVTHYVTHSYGRNADSRLRANWYGEGKKLTDRAYAIALQLAS